MDFTRRSFLSWTARTAGATCALVGAGNLGCAARTPGPNTAGTAGTGGDQPDNADDPPAGGPDIDPDGEPQSARARSVLILGGTGFLGPHVVEAALARGHTVTLFNRGKTNPHLFPDLEKLHGDRDGKLDALRGRRWDAVVDTSGYVPRIVGMSAKLLAPAIEHYVFISSVSAYANFPKPGVDEDHAVATIDDPANEDVGAHYGALKALSEAAAEAAMPGRVANIRPGLIVGPRDGTDRFTYWPVRVARGGEVLAPGTGADPVQLIDVRDLAAWIVHVIERGHVGVFNALGPEQPLTMRAVLEQCRQVTGSDARFTWVPGKFLAEQNVSPWIQMPLWAPAEGDFLGFTQVSNARAVARGLTFRPLEDTIRATLAWWNEQPAERRAKPRAGLPAEREAEVLAAWHRKRGG